LKKAYDFMSIISATIFLSGGIRKLVRKSVWVVRGLVTSSEQNPPAIPCGTPETLLRMK
jgi:hypothetical protein